MESDILHYISRMNKKNKTSVCFTLDKDVIKDIEGISKNESDDTGMRHSNSAVVNRMLKEKIKDYKEVKK